MSKINLIAGDSHSIGLDSEKLSRKGKRKVVNISQRGAQISDFQKALENYRISPEHTNGSVIVEKVFVCGIKQLLPYLYLVFL